MADTTPENADVIKPIIFGNNFLFLSAIILLFEKYYQLQIIYLLDTFQKERKLKNKLIYSIYGNKSLYSIIYFAIQICVKYISKTGK